MWLLFVEEVEGWVAVILHWGTWMFGCRIIEMYGDGNLIGMSVIGQLELSFSLCWMRFSL